MGRDGVLSLDEFRGDSGFIGGNNDTISLGTFLKFFNPDLYGPSLGQHFVELPGTPYYPKKDVLNAAQSEAASDNLPYQIEYLLKEMARLNISVENDWKVMNILIGANDACDLCNNQSVTPQEAADQFEKNFAYALSLLNDYIPKLLVSVPLMFNVSQVYNFAENITYCRDFHSIFTFECHCAFSPNISVRNWLDEVVQAYDERIVQVAAQYQAINSSSFAVVVQPFTQHLVIPSRAYISDLDCFHPSLLAHQKLAINLWNSMLTPVADKQGITFNPNATLICPGPDTFIYTS